ncbi:MAG: AlkA N-terminal domain-containing protein [Actinomycetota bacterium]|nr:AlkA N-terminal domain-containing protein [Actinomycetota bacterium]
MRAFSAVVTTGIYCRPDCSARPDPANVRPFEHPAAAEAAGFRACLRCRPYRLAQPLGVAGPELVCRAVRLIADGVLDGSTEADLGARLGVSGRHLRRLFVDHIGATPDQVARSRRTHFARRLLDDTDLPVTDVAFAAGFGSVRQLNRACHDIFRAPPSELRGRRRKADRLVADGGLVLRLPFDGPLDWDATLGYFAARAIPGVESVADGAYRRTIVVGGDPGVIELSAGGPDHLVLRAHLPRLDGLIHLVEQARRIANLDADPEGANRSLADDPTIGPLIAARPGLRPPGAWDPFELGVRAIVGQQVSVAGATTLVGRLVERLGEPVRGLDALGLGRTFPTADTVADADLDGLGFTGARAAAIRAFADAVRTGAVALDRGVPTDELVAAIEAVKGLGPWTAQYIAFRLGEPDAMPTGDLGLRRSLEGLRPGASLDDLAPGWSPWRATAAIHLWLAEAADTPAAASERVAAAIAG